MPNFLAIPTHRRQSRQTNEIISINQTESLVAAHRESRLKAREFVAEFVSERWGQHWNMISIVGGPTEAELLGFGRLPRNEGIRACCRLVRAPVIFEDIAVGLWERLSVDAAKEEKGGESHPSHTNTASSQTTNQQTSQAIPKGRYVTNNARKTSDTPTAELEYTPEKEPRKALRCVLCSGCDELACHIPEEIARLSRVGMGDDDQTPTTNEEEAGMGEGRLTLGGAKTRIWGCTCWTFRGVNIFEIRRAVCAFGKNLQYGYCIVVRRVVAKAAAITA